MHCSICIHLIRPTKCRQLRRPCWTTSKPAAKLPSQRHISARFPTSTVHYRRSVGEMAGSASTLTRNLRVMTQTRRIHSRTLTLMLVSHSRVRSWMLSRAFVTQGSTRHQPARTWDLPGLHIPTTPIAQVPLTRGRSRGSPPVAQIIRAPLILSQRLLIPARHRPRNRRIHR